MAILCPNCQGDLMIQDTQILGSQVTLAYEIVGELEIDCEKCTENVGEYLKGRVNAYGRLVNTLIPPTNVFHDLTAFIESIEEGLDSIQENRGGPRRARAIRLTFGLDDGISRSHAEVGRIFGTSRNRAWDVYNSALRMLRQLGALLTIHRRKWRPPDSFNTVLNRAEAAESKLKERQ